MIAIIGINISINVYVTEATTYKKGVYICLKIFCKIHSETPMPESPFDKVTDIESAA